MTEAEWLACTDPYGMLEFLRERISERKGILYVCGGLRQIWDRWLYADSSRNAVQVAECAADGQATEDEIHLIAYRAEVPTFGFDFDPKYIRESRNGGRFHPDIRRLIETSVFRDEEVDSPVRPIHGEYRLHQIKGVDPDEYDDPRIDDTSGNERLGDPEVVEQLLNAAHIAYHCLNEISRPLTEHLVGHIRQQQDWPDSSLLRCVFGNPFRPVAFDTAWQSETAISLASAIYAERAFDRLPILADALEEAGCDHPDVLTHCRGPEPHARGCWVVDGVLGKG